jgi:hypothetical protein
MNSETSRELPASDTNHRELLARILYMVVFGFAFWLASIVLGLAAILQLLMVLFTHERNEHLTQLGSGLAAYVAAIVLYLTFVSDEPPFPFADWPGGGQAPQD